MSPTTLPEVDDYLLRFVDIEGEIIVDLIYLWQVAFALSLCPTAPFFYTCDDISIFPTIGLVLGCQNHQT